MDPKTKSLILCVTLWALVACGGGGTEQNDTISPNDTSITQNDDSTDNPVTTPIQDNLSDESSPVEYGGVEFVGNSNSLDYLDVVDIEAYFSLLSLTDAQLVSTNQITDLVYEIESDTGHKVRWETSADNSEQVSIQKDGVISFTAYINDGVLRVARVGETWVKYEYPVDQNLPWSFHISKNYFGLSGEGIRIVPTYTQQVLQQAAVGNMGVVRDNYCGAFTDANFANSLLSGIAAAPSNAINIFAGCMPLVILTDVCRIRQGTDNCPIDSHEPPTRGGQVASTELPDPPVIPADCVTLTTRHNGKSIPVALCPTEDCGCGFELGYESLYRCNEIYPAIKAIITHVNDGTNETTTIEPLIAKSLNYSKVISANYEGDGIGIYIQDVETIRIKLEVKKGLSWNYTSKFAGEMDVRHITHPDPYPPSRHTWATRVSNSINFPNPDSARSERDQIRAYDYAPFDSNSFEYQAAGSGAGDSEVNCRPSGWTSASRVHYEVWAGMNWGIGTAMSTGAVEHSVIVGNPNLP